MIEEGSSTMDLLEIELEELLQFSMQTDGLDFWLDDREDLYEDYLQKN